ncbi:sigma factor [Micromonospora taraxaci]
MTRRGTREASRARLMSLAYRIVGSHNDAEHAVQAAWLRARSADPAQLVNPEGWLTTVTARLCPRPASRPPSPARGPARGRRHPRRAARGRRGVRPS